MTDAEAFRTYFEKWQNGDPVPGGWWQSDDGNWHRYFYDRVGCAGDKWSVHEASQSSPSPIDIQALIGVLVVRLAQQPSQLVSIDRCGSWVFVKIAPDTSRSRWQRSPLSCLVETYHDVVPRKGPADAK